MKTLYLDIFSGISGDMLIGALIDLGADARKLERELKKLKLDGYHLHVARQQKSGIAGVKFDVHLADAHEHHHEHELITRLPSRTAERRLVAFHASRPPSSRGEPDVCGN